MTYAATHNAISSPASAPFAMPDGPMIDLLDRFLSVPTFLRGMQRSWV